LAGCERPPPDVVQQGYRGTGMDAVQNPRLKAELFAKNVLPPMPPALPHAEGVPMARDIYKNLQVLTDLDVAQLGQVMAAQANWIAPKEQCAYCHNVNDFASDEKYTKVVARRMIQMTRDINVNWQGHVKQTGVTCYTCHRGNAVPQYTWFKPVAPPTQGGMAGNRNGQNVPAPSVLLASLPYDPYTPFLLEAQPIRVEATTPLPNGDKASIANTEQTYALMMSISKSMGVNCTHCHNAQQFALWNGAPPTRVQAWWAIRMNRHLNNDYLVPLTGTFPAARLGPTGDVAKVYCETCHQGVPKPFNGATMLTSYPEYARIPPPPPPPEAAAPATDGTAPAPEATPAAGAAATTAAAPAAGAAVSGAP
ncbi:MAG: photosynthetic reaction center cytochrome PufC, partial [Steroidobacteraceae bacterium]